VKGYLNSMKPKWYVPGLISLLGIFPLQLWKTIPYKKKFDNRVMNVYLPKEGDFDDRLLMFSEEAILSDVARKRQSAFYLNDFIEQREDVLEGIRHAALEIKLGYDTSRAVKVVLGNICTFNDLVSLMNICLMDEHKRWAWVKDSIYIFAPDPPRIYSQFVGCGYSDFNYYVHEDQKNKWCIDAFKVLSENKLLVSGYVILFYVSFRRRKEKFSV
jgi:hypothetical protein